jgi:hypothetical protein
MTQLDNFKPVPQVHRLQHDYILLDGSSSMQDKWWETLDAIQAYVDALKSNNVNSERRHSPRDDRPSQPEGGAVVQTSPGLCGVGNRRRGARASSGSKLMRSPAMSFHTTKSPARLASGLFAITLGWT